MPGERDRRGGGEKLAELGRFLEARVKDRALRDLRTRSNLRQVDVATKSGVSQQLLSDIESGRRGLSPEAAARLAPVLDVPRKELEAVDALDRLKLATKGQTTGRAAPGYADPRELLELMLFVDERLPDDEFTQQLRALVTDAIKESAEAWKQQAAVSLKHGKPASTRTGLGIRRRKPNVPRGY